MCSEIDRFSSFLRRNMSGGNNPEFLPVEKEENRETVSREIAAEEEKEKGNLGRADDDDDNQKVLEEIKNEEETTDKATVSPRDESKKQIAEDDDGFKTPTSSDHKIPTTTACPPAPKKTRPQLSKLKRKASPPSGACRSLQFDTPDEVESIFRPVPNQDDNAEEQKIKKARRDNED